MKMFKLSALSVLALSLFSTQALASLPKPSPACQFKAVLAVKMIYQLNGMEIKEGIRLVSAKAVDAGDMDFGLYVLEYMDNQYEVGTYEETCAVHSIVQTQD